MATYYGGKILKSVEPIEQISTTATAAVPVLTIATTDYAEFYIHQLKLTKPGSGNCEFYLSYSGSATKMVTILIATTSTPEVLTVIDHPEPIHLFPGQRIYYSPSIPGGGNTGGFQLQGTLYRYTKP